MLFVFRLSLLIFSYLFSSSKVIHVCFVFLSFSSGNVSANEQQSTKELKEKNEKKLRLSNRAYKDNKNQEYSEEMQDRFKNENELQSEESL
jgi:hypothetical protein